MARFSSTAYTKSHTNVAPRFSTTAILFPNGRQEFHKKIRATAPHTHTHSWKAHALSDHCPPLGCEGGFTWVHKPSTANSDKSRQIEFFAPNFFFNVSTFYVPLKSSSQSFTGLVNWGESAISSAVSRGILSPLSSFARKCALFRIVRAKG